MTTLGYRNSAIGSGLLHLVTEPAAAVAKSSMWRNPPSQAHGPNHVENPRTIYTFSKVNRSKNIALNRRLETPMRLHCAAGTPIDCRQIAFSPQTCFALADLAVPFDALFFQPGAAQRSSSSRETDDGKTIYISSADRHSKTARLSHRHRSKFKFPASQWETMLIHSCIMR